MSKHRISITMLIAIFAAIALAPSASAKSNHRYSSKVVSNVLSTADGYPGIGGTALLAGSVQTTLGAGAVVDRVTIVSQPAPNKFMFTGREVDYFAHGTQTNWLVGTSTIQPDGSQQVVVEGRYTGGTGRFRGATGQYRFVGTVPPGSTILTGRGHGNLRF